MIVFEAGTGKNKITLEERPDGWYVMRHKWGTTTDGDAEYAEESLANYIYNAQRSFRVKTPWRDFRPQAGSRVRYPREEFETVVGRLPGWRVSLLYGVARCSFQKRGCYAIFHLPTGTRIVNVYGTRQRALWAAENLDKCVTDPTKAESSDPYDAGRGYSYRCLQRVAALASLA